MNALFFDLFVRAVLTLTLLGVLAGYVSGMCERWWQRRAVRKEIAAMRSERWSLDSAATAQDRYSRRIP